MDVVVKQYTEAFKSRMVRRLVGPTAKSANAVAAEVGVSQESLSRWLRAAGNVGGMARATRKQWTGVEKLRVVREAHGLSESALGALLRREGLHEAQLTAWRTVAEAALTEPPRGRAAGRADPRCQDSCRMAGVTSAS